MVSSQVIPLLQTQILHQMEKNGKEKGWQRWYDSLIFISRHPFDLFSTPRFIRWWMRISSLDDDVHLFVQFDSRTRSESCICFLFSSLLYPCLSLSLYQSVRRDLKHRLETEWVTKSNERLLFLCWKWNVILCLKQRQLEESEQNHLLHLQSSYFVTFKKNKSSIIILRINCFIFQHWTVSLCLSWVTGKGFSHNFYSPKEERVAGT